MSLESLSDDEIEASLKRLVAKERECTADVLRHLAAMTERRIAEDRAYPSLFMYCVEELGYSEGPAYRRVQASKAAAKFKRIYGLLSQGKLTLTAVSMLAPHLTKENHADLLKRACGLRKKALEKLVASIA